MDFGYAYTQHICYLIVPKMALYQFFDDRARKSYGSLNSGPFGDAFGAMARAPALFFRLELADAIVYKFTTAFVDFNFTFLFID